jgi:hypothetical protein
MHRSILVLSLALASCGTTGVGEEFARDARRALASGTAAVFVDGHAVARASVSVNDADVPADVLRIETTIQPGGERALLAREYGDHGVGYRFVRVYAANADCPERTVLLDATGKVLERAHAIPPNTAPASVLEQVAAAGVGRVATLFAVQGAPGEEWYRIRLVAEDGRRHVLECAADGARRGLWRVLSGEIAVPIEP